MKGWLLLLFIMCFYCHGRSQKKELTHDPFPQLDSLSKCTSISKHFGHLYYVFLSMVEEQLTGLDITAQKQVRNFEKVFADFYIDACKAHWQNKEINVGEWQAYFSRTDLTPIQ
ncbi:MAG: hypothetical protein ABR503_01320, partial [Chitinophagaceae bacterium]